MTLPQNVADAMKSLECEIADPEDCTAWQNIRAHLMSQDAEIDRLRSVHRWNTDKLGGSLMVCRDEHEKGEACDWETFVPIERVELAESRLAAANELLREIGKMADGTLCDEVRDYLQGAGDEA